MEGLPDNVDEAIRSSLRLLAKGEVAIDHGACLDEEQLASYVEGLMGSRGAEQVERHLLKCARCRDTVIFSHRVNALLGEAEFTSAPEEVLHRLHGLAPSRRRGLREQLAATWTSLAQNLRAWGEALFFWNLQPATMRGGAVEQAPGLLTISRTFRTFKAVIRIECLNENLCEVKVQVLDRADRPMNSGVRVSLIAGQRELASYTAERGEVLFEEVWAGTYLIRIINRKLERSEIPLHIKGE